jgi:hypothetical protein
VAATSKDQNAVNTPKPGEYDPFNPPGDQDGAKPETTEQGTGDQEATTKRTTSKARGRSSTKKTEKLASDGRYLDPELFDDTTRKNFSTKIYPELEAKIQGIVTLSKMTGQPAGMTSVVAVIQEAVSRYVATVEEQDKLQIPKMHGR